MGGDGHIIYGLGASLIAAAVSTIGILAIAAFGPLVQRNSSYFSAFAVGLLTVAVMFHLLLEALNVSMDAIAWVGTGFMVMALIGMAVHASVNRRGDSAALTFGYASIIALAAHSFLDGVIYNVVFQEERFTGWLTTAGLLFHEFPEGVIAFFLLVEAGLSRGRAILYAFIAAGITTVAGTLTANSIVSLTAAPPLGAMYGSAAGAIIYVLVVHLIPHAARAPGKHGFVGVQMGVIVGTAAVILNSMSGLH